jgi:hypothetical protein
MKRGFYASPQVLRDSIHPRGGEAGNSPELKKS